ncbi:MAG: peptide chain release factor N(5)-glutamine methyltransferase [Pseudomonadota bacterium]
MSNTLKSYQDWLNWGARTLNEAGIDIARQEARWLLQFATGLSNLDLISLELDEFNSKDQISLYKSSIERRAKHEPLAHIEGKAEFYGLTFRTDARALIPRSDSETLINVALALLPTEAPFRIADLGTGTGCLLLTLLHERKNAHGVGIDLSADAVDLANLNKEALNLSDRAEIMNCSWTEWTGWGDVDFIVSNPPYIETDVIESLDLDVRLHDPFEALNGGEDGLDAYREIIKSAAMLMKPGARLIFETGYDQGRSVPKLLSDHGFSDVEVHKDLGSRDRVVSAQQQIEE